MMTTTPDKMMTTATVIKTAQPGMALSRAPVVVASISSPFNDGGDRPGFELTAGRGDTSHCDSRPKVVAPSMAIFTLTVTDRSSAMQTAADWYRFSHTWIGSISS